MAPVASQFSGGRRVTTGATGEATYNRKNGRRGSKRRRERDARAGKVVVDTEHEQGNLGGGGERGDQSHQWDKHTRETPENAEGAVSVSPSTNTLAKYCQPHRSRREHAQNHRVTGTDNRSSMAPAASQFLGGRQVTTGATGEATYNRKTDGEEARGGERGMHARAKWL